MSRASTFRMIVLSSLLLLSAGSALAQDVDAQESRPASKHVLITRAAVAAAGGFPYKITQPGSYTLESNLAPPANTAAVVIMSNDVVADLNGYNVTCSASVGVVACISDGGQAYSGITIRNGSISTITIAAFPPPLLNGIDLQASQGALIEDLHFDNGGNGTGLAGDALLGSPYSIYLHNTFVNVNVTFACPSLLEGNVVNQTNAAGFHGGSASGCTLVNNINVPTL